MAKALHLVKGEHDGLVAATVARQLVAGDTVTVVAIHGATLPALPAGIVAQRVPDDLSWEALLEAMFEADQVIAW